MFVAVFILERIKGISFALFKVISQLRNILETYSNVVTKRPREATSETFSVIY